MKIFLLFFALIGFSFAEPVKLTVTGVRNGEGQVAALVYRSEKGFPDQRGDAFKIVSAPAKEGVVTLTLDGLEPGKYAIAVIHDENGNGVMERNILRIPKEGVGVTGGMGYSKPKFLKSVIEVKAGETVTIPLKYF